MDNKNFNKESLVNIANSLMVAGKGLIAMDESNPTCNKRFAQFGIPQTAELRRQYRDLIVTTPDLGKYISGAILYDETVRQRTNDGSSFIDKMVNAGIIPGIKADMGTVDLAGFPGEKITEGLDGLRDRLNEYAGLGLRFAKWRAVITIGNGIPTDTCIAANMQTLAQYAAFCQEAGMVPIVEPEVLMDGTHSISQCFEVTERVLTHLFNKLYKQRIDLEGILLKPNMVLAGVDSTEKNSVMDVADATVKCLLRCVPAEVPGIAFLSGGQSTELATEHLNAMHVKYGQRLPWALTFSFSRALQLPALEIWKGKDENRLAAQQALLYRAKCNSAARMGEYKEGLA
ncbi:MAG: fructose-bisphosphate aldolase class I [Taibaiella sp.]|nr:fructose-bisphosphate aldolase class I [Taibaiella sp.]